MRKNKIIPIRRCLFLMFITIVLVFVYHTAHASLTCHGRLINPLTDVDWHAIFPLSVGGKSVVRGTLPDTRNPKSPVCHCLTGDMPRVGLAIGFWEPLLLVEVTRTPFCLVGLGGISLGLTHHHRGAIGEASPEAGNSFYHVHVYRFPLLAWLNVLTDAACLSHGDLDVLYLSELDPSWQNEAIALLLHPESALFANKESQNACAIDAIQAIQHLPSDYLFWCAGAQGSLYPLTGYVSAHVSALQAGVLLLERAIAKLQRFGLLWRVDTAHERQLCHARYQPTLAKSPYRYQLVYPTRRPAQPFGRSTVLWGAGATYPIKGEDMVFLVFRKRNCCAF